MKYPKRVNIIEVETAPFRNSDDGDAWARSHGVIGLMSNVDTGAMAGIAYRAKTTLKRHVDPKAKDNQPTKAYSYEINNIEVMAGTAEPQSSPTPQTSMDTDILLNGVCDVNGVPLLSEEGRAKREERRGKSGERGGRSEEGRGEREERGGKR